MAGRLRSELKVVEELIERVTPLRERFDTAIPPSARVPELLGKYIADAAIDPKARAWLDADVSITVLEEALLDVAALLETRIQRSEKRRNLSPDRPDANG